MSISLITLGEFNKKYLYIVFSIISLILTDILSGFNYNNSFVEVIKDEKALENFSKNTLIKHIFCYIGTLISSIILYKYENKKSNTESYEHELDEEKMINKNNKKDLKFEYIHTPKINFVFFSKNTIYWILFIIFLWVFEEHAIQLHSFLKDLDFWMIEIIIVSLLCAYMFKQEIYKHQKLIFAFNIIPIILKVVTIILSFCDEGNDMKEKGNYLYNNTLAKNNTANYRLKNLYVIYNWIVPVGIIVYLLLITLRSYVNAKIKEFMDLKYISIHKLLIYYSIMGIIFCTIVCTITTFVKCEDITIPSNSTKKDIYDYICLVTDNQFNNKTSTNHTQKYFDSFYVYFKNFNENKNAITKVFILIAEIIFFIFHKYFSVLIIKHFTPVHIIISFPVYFVIQKIILIINTEIRKQKFFDDERNFNYRTEKFCLDIFGDITSILGFLVYLEMVELNFCEFNYNLRKNIIYRGDNETIEGMGIEIGVLQHDDENEN